MIPMDRPLRDPERSLRNGSLPLPVCSAGMVRGNRVIPSFNSQIPISQQWPAASTLYQDEHPAVNRSQLPDHLLNVISPPLFSETCTTEAVECSTLAFDMPGLVFKPDAEVYSPWEMSLSPREFSALRSRSYYFARATACDIACPSVDGPSGDSLFTFFIPQTVPRHYDSCIRSLSGSKQKARFVGDVGGTELPDPTEGRISYMVTAMNFFHLHVVVNFLANAIDGVRFPPMAFSRRT